jgi:hypothetical protein
VVLFLYVCMLVIGRSQAQCVAGSNLLLLDDISNTTLKLGSNIRFGTNNAVSSTT